MARPWSVGHANWLLVIGSLFATPVISACSFRQRDFRLHPDCQNVPADFSATRLSHPGIACPAWLQLGIQWIKFHPTLIHSKISMPHSVKWSPSNKTWGRKCSNYFLSCSHCQCLVQTSGVLTLLYEHQRRRKRNCFKSVNVKAPDGPLIRFRIGSAKNVEGHCSRT